MDRQLTAMHPRLVITAAGGPPITTWNLDGRSGWQPLGGSTMNQKWYHRTDIDLSGYALQDMTFFPTGVGVQDPGLYKAFFQAPDIEGFTLQVLDIITSIALSEFQINQLTSLQLDGIAMGMLGSSSDFETIILGSYRAFTFDSNLKSMQGVCSLLRSQRFGSGEPNASDRLFSYRIIQWENQPDLPNPFLPNDQIVIPAARHLLNGEFVEEDDLVYMQRLKRSVELARDVTTYVF